LARLPGPRIVITQGHRDHDHCGAMPGIVCVKLDARSGALDRNLLMEGDRGRRPFATHVVSHQSNMAGPGWSGMHVGQPLVKLSHPSNQGDGMKITRTGSAAWAGSANEVSGTITTQRGAEGLTPW
jgi:hypothetical protein